jgi:23S rRNA G2445 N2-methylase RlmL
VTVSTNSSFLVTCVPGLEPLVQLELHDLGVEAEPDGSGVLRFQGTLDQAVTILIKSRIASRVLKPVRLFSAKSPEMLYDQVRRVNWNELIPADLTFAVFSHGVTSTDSLTLNFANLKIKDAICDEIRKSGRERPSVDRHDPDVRIEAHFQDGKCEISLDMAGNPLHRRGYREDSGDAPLRENRAAALLYLAGYDGTQPLIDPFCGSGTLVIEAALKARNIAPGLLRESGDFSLSKWSPEGRKLLEAQHSAAFKKIKRKCPCPIVGRDISDTALKNAKANAKRAGLLDDLAFEKGDARQLLASHTLVVGNPPYGERLGDLEKATQLISEFTRQLKHHGHSCRLGFIIPKGLEKAVGFKPTKKVSLMSGDDQLRLLVYEIFQGQKGQKKTQGSH